MTNPQEQPHAGIYLTNFVGGGVQRAMVTITERLLTKGWRVDLYVVDATGSLRDQVPAAATLHNLGKRGAMAGFKALAREIKNDPPQVLFSSQPHLNSMAVLLRLLGIYKGRLVLNEQVALLQHAASSPIWKDRFNPLMAWLFYRFGDLVVCVSEQVADQLRGLHCVSPNKIRVIHNPIETPAASGSANTTAKMPWAAGTRVIIGAGRLTRQKDFSTLIDAFARVHQQQQDVCLLILGEGEDRPALQQQIEQLGLDAFVKMPGFVTDPFSYMRASNLFVLSSRWEGFGNVLVEALACGIPVVSTDCPYGPAEIIDHGRYGRLAPVGDAPALAEQILASLAAPMPAEQCLQRALDFSPERIMPMIEQALLGR